MPDPSVRVHPPSFDCDHPLFRAAGGDAATARAACGPRCSYGPAELDHPENLGHPPALIITPDRRTSFLRFLYPILGVFRPLLGVGDAPHRAASGSRSRSARAARPAGGVRTSSEADLLHGLEVSFSPEHMDAYLQAAQGDRTKALRLFTWNTDVSEAFHAPLQGLELALRHAMHRELAACYGADWYNNPAAGLDFRSRDRLAAAKRAAERPGHPVAPPQVVEKLCFGFWTALLSSGGPIDRSSGRKADYARTLWAPALRGAFPHRAVLTRGQAQRALDRLRRLRNKVAHHEPIFTRPLREDHQRILAVTGWISPDARAWIERNSRVPRLFATWNGASDVDLLLTEVQAA